MKEYDTNRTSYLSDSGLLQRGFGASKSLSTGEKPIEEKSINSSRNWLISHSSDKIKDVKVRQ